MEMKKRANRVAMVFLLMSVILTQSALAQEGSVWSGRKSGWQLLTESQRKEVFDFAETYKTYLKVARTAMTSTREVIKLAKASGFIEFNEAAQVKPGARLIFSTHDRALILAVVGSEPLMAGSRLVATHHDSPHIGLKGRPIIPAAGGNFALFKTIYYGGIKKYQWANVPLGLIGRIDTTDGRMVEVSIGFKPEDPVFVIPDSAPHSDVDLRMSLQGKN
jgi:aspartyl aminopeptidase